MKEVSIYCGNKLTVNDIIDFSNDNLFDFSHLFFATGAIWRRDGMGRQHRELIPGIENLMVFTPDEIMDGVSVNGKVVIFDDDHFYMGGVLAEKLRKEGHEVVFVTPAPDISTYTHKTLEQRHIQKKLIDLGVELFPNMDLFKCYSGRVELSCVFTEDKIEKECDSLLLITERIQNDELKKSVEADKEKISSVGIKTLKSIGDCYAPGTMAAAVYSGHLAAREFQTEQKEDVPFLRERIKI